MTFPQPDYVAPEMFSWSGLGYHWPGSTPAELRSAAALESRNPWVVLAAVLERAKTGDFEPVARLIRCLQDADDWVLSRACAELLGDAGPVQRIAALRDRFKEISEQIVL